MYRYYSPYQSHLCCPFLQEVDGRRRLPAVTVRSEPEQNTNKKNNICIGLHSNTTNQQSTNVRQYTKSNIIYFTVITLTFNTCKLIQRKNLMNAVTKVQNVQANGQPAVDICAVKCTYVYVHGHERQTAGYMRDCVHNNPLFFNYVVSILAPFCKVRVANLLLLEIRNISSIYFEI